MFCAKIHLSKPTPPALTGTITQGVYLFENGSVLSTIERLFLLCGLLVTCCHKAIFKSHLILPLKSNSPDGASKAQHTSSF